MVKISFAFNFPKPFNIKYVAIPNAAPTPTTVNNSIIPRTGICFKIIPDNIKAPDIINIIRPTCVALLNPIGSPLSSLIEATFANAYATNIIPIPNDTTERKSTSPTILNAIPIARTPAAIKTTVFTAPIILSWFDFSPISVIGPPSVFFL